MHFDRPTSLHSNLLHLLLFRVNPNSVDKERILSHNNRFIDNLSSRNLRRTRRLLGLSFFDRVQELAKAAKFELRSSFLRRLFLFDSLPDMHGHMCPPVPLDDPQNAETVNLCSNELHDHEEIEDHHEQHVVAEDPSDLVSDLRMRDRV